MAYDASQLLDLVAETLNDLPKQVFEVLWTDQDYEACRIYQQDRMVIDGGKQIERHVMLDHNGMARYRRYYDTDDPSVGDHMDAITVPWTQLTTNYSWDELEIKHQMNSAKGFIDLMKTKRIAGLWALADLIEDRFWKTPNSSTDKLYPYGVPYYLNMINADEATNTEGFYGGTIRYQNASTGTACAGIDTASVEKWKNYAAVYTNIDNTLMKQLRVAFMKTRFKAPLFINDPSDVRGMQKRMYADSDTIAELMDFADAKDDNHSGKDVLGRMIVNDGATCLINRLPLVWVPQLEGDTDPETGDTTSPIYCVDFKYFRPVIHDGYWMRETKPMTDKGQHTVYTVFLDGAHQNLCTNRRRAGFVFHKALAA